MSQLPPEPSHKQINQEDNRSLEQHIFDAMALLSAPVSSMHSRRALLYGISDHIARRHKLSEKSRQRMADFGSQYWTKHAFEAFKSPNGRKQLSLEHPVPRGIVTEALCPIGGDVKAPVGGHLVQRAIKLFDITCWVHDDERKLVDGHGYGGSGKGSKSKVAMPPGWDFLTGNPWCRYTVIQSTAGEQKLSQWKTWTEHLRHSRYEEERVSEQPTTLLRDGPPSV